MDYGDGSRFTREFGLRAGEMRTQRSVHAIKSLVAELGHPRTLPDRRWQSATQFGHAPEPRRVVFPESTSTSAAACPLLPRKITDAAHGLSPLANP